MVPAAYTRPQQLSALSLATLSSLLHLHHQKSGGHLIDSARPLSEGRQGPLSWTVRHAGDLEVRKRHWQGQ